MNSRVQCSFCATHINFKLINREIDKEKLFEEKLRIKHHFALPILGRKRTIAEPFWDHCPNGSVRHDNSCYIVSHQLASWPDALVSQLPFKCWYVVYRYHFFSFSANYLIPFIFATLFANSTIYILALLSVFDQWTCPLLLFWMSPFVVVGVTGGCFHFHCIFHRNS